MAKKSVVKRIEKFNRDRNPELLKYKWDALSESPFRFFRGTCHLFYADIPVKSFLLNAPKSWICGDLHLENFGSFKGDNRVAYFDMNDFDESLLAPCLFDVARLCTSVYLAADLVEMSKAECRKIVQSFLNTYAEHLAKGFIRSVEQESAKGIVKTFLDRVTMLKRQDLLQKRVDFSYRTPKLRIHEPTSIQASPNQKKHIKEVIEAWAHKHAANPQFYKVLDVSIRANGTGSIGIERYLVLVYGKGGSDGLFLLDVKQALKASALKSLKLKQPEWNNEAERLIAIQSRVEAAPPAFLHPIKIDKNWFVMRELQPLEDKINLESLQSDGPAFKEWLKDMGAVVAWNNLRCGGRQGSAITDDLIKFGEQMHKIEAEINDYAEAYAEVTKGYFEQYKNRNAG